MSSHTGLDYDTVEDLLDSPENKSTCEETKHAWSSKLPDDSNAPSQPIRERLQDVPLLRAWDCYCGSQPDAEDRMLARAFRQRLDTREARHKSLGLHANNYTRDPTPYISFTSSSAALQELVEMRCRQPNRGPCQKLTVIDPRRRFALGLPIIHYRDEVEHYKVATDDRFLDNHFLCLWEVTPAEVVGTWEWEYLRSNPRWYEAIILPAWKAFRESSHCRSVVTEAATKHPEDWQPSEDPASHWGDTDDDEVNKAYFPSDSEDSYERLCEEHESDDLLKMLEERL